MTTGTLSAGTAGIAEASGEELAIAPPAQGQSPVPIGEIESSIPSERPISMFFDPSVSGGGQQPASQATVQVANLLLAPLDPPSGNAPEALGDSLTKPMGAVPASGPSGSSLMLGNRPFFSGPIGRSPRPTQTASAKK
jgi:hypothetical protein